MVVLLLLLLFKFLFTVTAYKFLAVVDFDHTIVDENSLSIIKKIVPENELPVFIKETYDSVKSYIPYTNLVFKKVYDLKVTEESYLNLISDIPVIQDMDRVFMMLYKLHCDTIIISNSHSIFINKWLKHKSLLHTVKEVHSNPARFDENGLLTVEAYHNQTECEMSPQNLCKQAVLRNFLIKQTMSNVSYDYVLYIGDGRNDVCAVRILRYYDLIFARTGFWLYKLIASCPIVRARIHGWSTGKDIIDVLERRFIDLIFPIEGHA